MLNDRTTSGGVQHLDSGTLLPPTIGTVLILVIKQCCVRSVDGTPHLHGGGNS